MSDKQKEAQNNWLANKAPNYPKAGVDPEFDEKRYAGQLKGAETNKRKAKIRRKLQEVPAGFYEDILAGYLAEDPEFGKNVMKVLAEQAVQGDTKALSALKTTFGFGAPTKAAPAVDKKDEVKKLSKDEIDQKLKVINGGKG